jgi:CHAD domain-containing protein
MGELAFAVVRRQFATLRAKEPGTRLGEDPEELHDMRVATRRLRAGLSLFAHVFPVRAQAFRQELGWLGRTLGAVRDLDVQLAGLDDLAGATAGWSDGLRADGHGQDPLADLAELLTREREAARADMLGALDSVRWERLAKGLAAMAQQGPARRSLATRVPAVIGMPELIVARHDAVAKAAGRAKKSKVVADFHRLRIKCKRLRYSLEFASDVYEGRTTRYVRELTAVQDELGLMQDAEVASVRLAELATGDPPLPAATVFVMGGVAEAHRRDVERHLRRLPKHASRVDGRAWRDLRDVLEERRAEAEAAQPPLRRTLRAVPPPAAPPASPGAADETPGTPDVAAHPAAGGGGLTALSPPGPSSQRE